ncbi:ABC transporter substrate-binding protein [Streptomyces sp. NPDC051322]|uniref:ABC transporter substrate-binding protein n=1 Tax=Streptomyces sp. NPDC051322 TaxID=3154645 RepID=UPI00344DF209
MQEIAWQFTDDRGQLSAAGRPPTRLVAYIQAGATLRELGRAPVAVFGSLHDGALPDPAKAGSLRPDRTGYLGAGGDLDLETLLRGGTELVVAVSYGGGQVYGLDPDTAKHLEEHVPVVVIDIGRSRTMSGINARFGALARSLGADEDDEDPEAGRLLAGAQQQLSAAAPARPTVLALSPAGPDQVHLARPGGWPQLADLTERGVNTVQPPEGAGANWATVSWDRAAALRPEVVLVDVRSNATPLAELGPNPGWRAIESGAEVVPWNPEAPCTDRAHARFLTSVAEAMARVGAR